MIDLKTGVHQPMGKIGQNYVSIDFLQAVDSYEKEGVLFGDGAPAATLKYVLIIQNIVPKYYLFGLIGRYYPKESFTNMADWTHVPHTKDEELELLMDSAKENALKNAEKIIKGKSNAKAISIYRVLYLQTGNPRLLLYG
jgi:hypothetical protein